MQTGAKIVVNGETIAEWMSGDLTAVNLHALRAALDGDGWAIFQGDNLHQRADQRPPPRAVRIPPSAVIEIYPGAPLSAADLHEFIQPGAK